MVTKSSLIVLLTAVLMSVSAHAQTTGEGSAAFGAGAYSNGFSSGRVMQFGGGGEAVFERRLGVGGNALFSGGGGDGWLESSLGMSYRFPAIGVTKRTEPFLSGGLTMLGALTEPAGRDGFNVGGGFTHWFGREGARIVLRDVVFGNGAWTTQYWTVRIGIVFR